MSENYPNLRGEKPRKYVHILEHLKLEVDVDNAPFDDDPDKFIAAIEAVQSYKSVDFLITVLLSQSWFKSLLSSGSRFISIKIALNGDIFGTRNWPLHSDDICNATRLLIVITSTETHQILVFWKNEDAKVFLRLELTDENIAREVKSFAVDFIAEGIKEPGYSVISDRGETSLVSLWQSTGINMTQKAVIEGNQSILRELLKQPFDVHICFYVGDDRGKFIYWKLVDFAWQEDHQEVVLVLLEAGSTYPISFEKKLTSREIKNFLAISENLHHAISAKNIGEINRIIQDNPSQRHFFNANNISAVHCAILLGHSDIYEMLTEYNLTFGPDEDFQGKIADNFGKELSAINSDLARPLPQRHLMLLLFKSVVARCDPNPSESHKAIKASLESVDSLDAVQPILRVIACERRMKIHFDFTQFSVVFMEPTVGPHTRGLFNARNNHLHIAAKGLLDDQLRNETEAVMVHEFDHFALNSVFKNSRLPYGKDDEENRKLFERVMEECKKVKDADDIVNCVFENYKEEAWERELAVRAPHMIVHYQDDQEKLEILKTVYAGLFAYHEKVILPAMKEAVPVLEKLNNESVEIRFDELTEPLKAAIRHSPVTFQGVTLKIREIASDFILKNSSSHTIRKILDGKTFSLGEKLKEEKNEFFVERKFIKSNFKYDVYHKGKLTVKAKSSAVNVDKIVEKSGKSRLILLSNDAGEGKSVTFRRASVGLKEKFPTHWISYVSMAEHENALQAYQRVTKFDARTLCEIFKTILAITNGTKEDFIFTHLFNSGQMILLLDSIDDIAVNFESFLENFMKSLIKTTKITLWIAMRPHHMVKVIGKRSREAFKLLQLSKFEVKKFVRHLLNAEEDMRDHKKLQMLKKIRRKINELKFSVNPMMLRKISQLIITDQFFNYKWVPSSVSRNMDIVPDAVLAGRDLDGNAIYVGRSFHDGDNLPAAIMPDKQLCLVAYGGSAVAKKSFDYLAGCGFAWKQASDGNVPLSSVTTGITSNHEPLYIGRAIFEESLMVGKVHQRYECLFLPHNGAERSTNPYEVLVCPKPRALWVPAQAYAPLPANAVFAGDDNDGDIIHVGRCVEGVELLPAKIVGRNHNGFVGYAGREKRNDVFEVLCGSNVQWVPKLGGAAHPHAVVGGYTRTGETLFIGRASWHGSVTCGKILPSAKRLYIPFNCKEIEIEDYEVLVEF